MWLNATHQLPDAQGHGVKTFFTDRAWIPQGGTSTDVDTAKLADFLRGCPRGPQVHLIADEFFRIDPTAAKLRRFLEVLRTYATVRPDIIRAVYTCDLTTRPAAGAPHVESQWQKARKRARSTIEREIARLTHFNALDQYLAGIPLRGPAPAGERLGPQLKDQPDEGTSLEYAALMFDESRKIASFMEEKLGVRSVVCLHESYHGGSGLNWGIWMSEDVWTKYLGLARDRWDHACWWSGPHCRDVDGRYVCTWSPVERYAPYAAVIDKVYS